MSNPASHQCKSARYLGLACGYLLFTLVLFFVLSILGKLPLNWSILHIAGITLLITLGGMALKRLLK